MENTVTISKNEEHGSVDFSMTGDVTFDISIQEAYVNSTGDYELVSYNGDEYGFNPETDTLLVFSPGIKISLPTEITKSFDDALTSVFDV